MIQLEDVELTKMGAYSWFPILLCDALLMESFQQYVQIATF